MSTPRPLNTSTVTVPDSPVISELERYADEFGSTVHGVATVLLTEVLKDQEYVQALGKEGLYPRRKAQGRPRKARA